MTSEGEGKGEGKGKGKGKGKYGDGGLLRLIRVAEEAAEGKVAAGVGDVAGDLVAEGLGGGEGAFGAEAAEEGEAEGRLLGEGPIAFKGVEVEQVGLDGEGAGAEGGAVADVGDGREGLPQGLKPLHSPWA